MSTHSRRTTVRAIEAPPSTSSSRRSKSRYSENHRSTSGTQQLVTYQRSPSNATRSSRYSRPPPDTALQRTSPADFSLPRSARKVPLPYIKPGSRVSITITSPEEDAIPSRKFYRGDSSPVYTRRTTETYVFSPRNNGPKDYSLPPPRQPTQFSARSRPSRRMVRMPSSGESGYRSTYTRQPERLAPSRPERTYLSSRTSTPRSSASASTARPVSQRALEQASLDFDDTETLAPSDSISQASSKARRKQRSAESASKSRRS